MVWPTTCPAVVDIAGWKGNIVDALNTIPSGAWNDFLYTTLSPVFESQGHPLVSLTGSEWVDYNGNLALSFEIGVDPLDVTAVAAILMIGGALILAGLDGAIASFNPPLAVILAALIVGGILALSSPIVEKISPAAVNFAFVAVALGVVVVGGAIAYAYFTKPEARRNVNEAASGIYSGAKGVAKDVYSAVRGG